jgi:hypothetical protein
MMVIILGLSQIYPKRERAKGNTSHKAAEYAETDMCRQDYRKRKIYIKGSQKNRRQEAKSHKK